MLHYRPLMTPQMEHIGCLRTIENSVTFSTNVMTTMKERGRNEAYVHREGTAAHLFELKYTDDFAGFVGNMSTLHHVTKSAADRYELDQIAESMAAAREAQLVFDPSWLVSLGETIVFNELAERVEPLVRCPGRLVVTTQRLYFQPLFHVDAEPVARYRLADVRRIERRRFMLAPRGVEVFYERDEGAHRGLTSVFFALRTSRARDACFATLAQQTGPDTVLHERALAEITRRWQCRLVSNFDYLMFLNQHASRSFNDLTQYPVFPWVVADYTSARLDLASPATFRDLSKPVGALNPARLAKLRARYREMPEPKFLYGTHYSTPGYVLYYLVREAPEYQLRLQNGRFDHPDRIFCSIADTWNSVLTNSADFKELIPEFYCFPAFLTNTENLDLGVRTADAATRTPIADVVLPPWAASPADFVAQMRAALESDHVSAHLHEWIDLIFGYKQRGQPAVDADNVFYHLTYEGAVDMEHITDPVQRQSYQDQIREFGQTPSRLFTAPHPQRLSAADAAKAQLQLEPSPVLTPSPPPSPSPSSSYPSTTTPRAAATATHQQQQQHQQVVSSPRRTDTGGAMGGGVAFPRRSCDYTPGAHVKLHRETITDCCTSTDGSVLYTVSQDACLRAYSLQEQRQLRMTSFGLALSGCRTAADSRTLVLSSWDDNLYVYSVDCGRVSDTVPAHDDAVSCVHVLGDRVLSGSWDATVKLWQFRAGTLSHAATAVLLEGDAGVSCVDLAARPNAAISGSTDGALVLYDLRAHAPCATVVAHTDAVRRVLFGAGARVVSIADDGHLKIWDARQFSADGAEAVCDYVPRARPTALLLHAASNTAFVGTAAGTVELWDTTGAPAAGPCATLPCAGDAAVTALCACEGAAARVTVAGDEGGSVTLYRSPLSH